MTVPAVEPPGALSPKHFTVAVIICAYTEARWSMLTKAIAASLRQSRVPDELIVVVDHNPGLEHRLRSEFSATARLQPNTHEQGLSGARNTGVEVATSEILIFLDDDAIPASDWLEQHLKAFVDDTVVGTGGWVEPAWERPPPPWWPPTFNWVVGCSYVGLPSAGALIRNPIGASMALRREAVTQVGGFSSHLGRVGTLPLGCEETELSIRICQQRPEARFVHASDSRVDHFVPAARASFRYLVSRCWAEGHSKALVALSTDTTAALASERTYAAVTLPKAVLSDVMHGLLEPVRLLRALVTCAAFATTAVSYLISRSRPALSYRLGTR